MANPPRIDIDSIFSTLRDEIISGAHAPGSPFREIALSKRFGVSRTPIRTVLSRLEQDGLLDRVGRGLQVPYPDPERVIQVYDMRILLEANAAQEASQARQLSDTLRMEALLARDRELQNPDDHERMSTNLEFHAAIWRATHNPVLIDLLERLSTHLVHSPRSTLSDDGRWEQSLDEHAAILEAIVQRDGDKANELARTHMSKAREIRLELLREAAIKSL